MIVVIQCAGSKRKKARSFCAPDGRTVRFVAHPKCEQLQDDGNYYARPDDLCADGTTATWRERLEEINRHESTAKSCFLPAGCLYKDPIYQQLLQHVGAAKLYILSAGWGLVRSDFRLPDYDITFSAKAAPPKRRHKRDSYRDFSMLPKEGDEGSGDSVLFLGGVDYLKFFSQLSERHRGPRIVMFNSAQPPHVPGCKMVRYETNQRMNWHYGAAKCFIEGKLQIPD